MRILTLAAYGALSATAVPALAQSTDLDIIDNKDVVLTPTRLRQSIAEVPGSVTVITAEMLERYGISTIPEALRLVPGMAVAQFSGGQYSINYHGGTAISPRRLNLLIDGVSSYRSMRAEIDWTMLPVAIGDIERIEVTRGPNSASYGPNSLLGIINIITKHPSETAGGTVGAMMGSRETRGATAGYGGPIGGSTRYWLAIDHRETAGFKKVAGNGFTLPGINARHDSSERNLLTFRASTELGQDESLDFRFALLKGQQDYPLVDQYQRSYPDTTIQDGTMSMIWRKHFSPDHALEIAVSTSRHNQEQPWKACLPLIAFLPEVGKLWTVNPEYVLAIQAGKMPSGGKPSDDLLAAAALKAIRALGAKAWQPACASSDQNILEKRHDIELQTTNVFSDIFRTVAGVGVRRDAAASATFLGGKVKNDAWRAFINAEYRPVPSVVVNAGGYYERDELTGGSFSPRIALNKHFDANNTVRFVLSRATRMPGIHEQRTNWSYLAKGLDPSLLGTTEARYVQSARSPGNLKAEENTSREIGYLGNFSSIGLVVDLRVFHDKLTDLISERLSLVKYNPTNSNSLTHQGAEVQVSYVPALNWDVHAGYSYLDAKASTVMDLTQYSRNSGVLALSNRLPNDVTLSLAVYANQGSPTGQSTYGRQDFTVSKRFRLGRVVLHPSFVVSHLDRSQVRYFYDDRKSITNQVGQHIEYQFSLRGNL